MRQAEYWQAYYAEHAVRLRARSSAWARANADRRADATRRRRARTRGALAFRVSNTDLDRALRRADWACAYCREDLTQIHWDHAVPIARGGVHGIGNLVPACPGCNQQKHAKTITEWRIWRDAWAFLIFRARAWSYKPVTDQRGSISDHLQPRTQ